jgi:hypothetical protein
VKSPADVPTLHVSESFNDVADQFPNAVDDDEDVTANTTPEPASDTVSAVAATLPDGKTAAGFDRVRSADAEIDGEGRLAEDPELAGADGPEGTAEEVDGAADGFEAGPLGELLRSRSDHEARVSMI